MQTDNLHEFREVTKEVKHSPYLLWLIWVVWLPLIIPAIVRLFQTHPSVLLLIVALTSVILFFGIYLWGSWQSAKRFVASASTSKLTIVWTWLTIIALTALSLVLALLGRENEWLAPLFFTSGYIGGSLPMRKAVAVGIVFMLLAVIVSRFAGLTLVDLVQAIVFIPAVIFIVKSVLWSITTSWELTAARKEIARLAVTTERLRIARDLHDLLGHNLSLIALKSELARRLVGVSPERAVIEIGDVEQVARTTLQEVREAVANYRQPTLLNELQGAQEILTAAGITYSYEDAKNNGDTLPTSVEAVLAWTVREGVTNVIKHSRAHSCTIRMAHTKQLASVEVIDDGIAIPQPQDKGATNVNNNGGGNGLKGLAERVATLGGQFDAKSRIDGGFRLAVSVPVVQKVRTTGAGTDGRPQESRPTI
jgi:two-component system sensor histidine kinase DesK